MIITKVTLVGMMSLIYMIVLAITKSLVDLMEGTIKVESEEGIGSAFIVKLDQKVIEENNVEVL